MGRNPTTLMAFVGGVVPLLVAGAGGATFLLLRAGYGIVISGLLPLAGLLIVIGVLGALLGRSVNTSRGEERKKEE